MVYLLCGIRFSQADLEKPHPIHKISMRGVTLNKVIHYWVGHDENALPSSLLRIGCILAHRKEKMIFNI